MQVPPAYLLSAPIILEGRVVEGFGRGSSQMGVPTANIEPGPLKNTLEGLPLGVYFGLAPFPVLFRLMAQAWSTAFPGIARR